MITIKSATTSFIALTLEEKTPTGFGSYSIDLYNKTTRQGYEFNLENDLSDNIERYNLYEVDFNIPDGQYDYMVMAHSLTGPTASVRVESGRLNVEKI